MNHATPHNDEPISKPSDDRFGIDPFAKALSTSIMRMSSPHGYVVALTGPWGSGKSSAVNLILHHLEYPLGDGRLTLINFECWWFRGEEALALAFFQKLHSSMRSSLKARAAKALSRLGSRLLRTGALVGSAIDVAGGGGAGAVAANAMDFVGGLISDRETVEHLHAELSTALANQPGRFLVVIDNIDRLSPEEALLIFRLVKSVGRLPNVIYLLVFDRQLAEKIVSDRFPSEGPNYLEKIVQAAFELPEPRHSDLCDQLLATIGSVCGEVDDENQIVEFMNLFYEAVAPEIRTPRDLIRIANMIAVSWPAVSGEVNLGDFVSIETLRLLQPQLFRAIRSNKDALCTVRESRSRNREEQQREYDKTFLSSVAESERARYRRVLMRLFPPLEAVWNNLSYSGESAEQWSRRRRACSKAHFDSYFRYSPSDDSLSSREIEELVGKAGNRPFIRKQLHAASRVKTRTGTTKVPLVLEALRLHSDRVETRDIESLLSTIFEMADELDIESDKVKGFASGDNALRIHWLLRRLVRDRLSDVDRSSVLKRSCARASFGWLVDFASSAYDEHHPREGRSAKQVEQCLLTSADTEEVKALARQRISDAAKSGALMDSAQLAYILFRWREFAGDKGKAVRDWTHSQLTNDTGVIRFAEAFTGHSWSQGVGGLGDLVSRRRVRAGVSGLEDIIDVKRFRARLEELEKRGRMRKVDARIVADFLGAWRKQEAGERD